MHVLSVKCVHVFFKKVLDYAVKKSTYVKTCKGVILKSIERIKFFSDFLDFQNTK